ncbi:MAG: hypothetical protein H0X33_09205 [Taibaiella sp.]|nr:hypothetical protein [Taibaiella sp.]
MRSPIKVSVFTLLSILSGVCGFSQSLHYSDSTRFRTVTGNTAHRPVVKKIKPIHTELSVGFRLQTDGWSLYVDRGRVKSDDEKRSDMFYNIGLWQAELGERKNPKEYKSTNSNLDPFAGVKPTPFIFGKINNFYTFKLGIGRRVMIAGKPDPGSVSIHWVYLVGLSVGMLKPYYIKTDNEANPIKYSDATRSKFLTESNIIGSAGFTQGLSEITFIPGFHAKTALHFDFAANRKTALAIETGMNVELYSQSIPLMINQDAKPYFFDLFAAFQFGKRW